MTSTLGDRLTGSHLLLALVGSRKIEVRRELLHLVDSHGLREDVSRVQVHVDVFQVDISGQNTLSDEVIAHFDVLGPSMED